MDDELFKGLQNIGNIVVDIKDLKTLVDRDISPQHLFFFLGSTFYIATVTNTCTTHQSK
jgi:hypothetical protein